MWNELPSPGCTPDPGDTSTARIVPRIAPRVSRRPKNGLSATELETHPPLLLLSTMPETARLANHLRRTFDGPMWHGPALNELLTAIPVAHATARQVPHAHTIAELVLHMTAWANIARDRLRGTASTEVRTEEDWPPVNALDDRAWKDAIARLRASYDELATAVEALDDAALRETVAGRDHSVRAMLHGVIEHGVYHGGQIALLKRAVEGAPPSR